MTQTRTRPWLRGIVDILVGATVIMESTIPTRNRLVVILVDSTFEKCWSTVLLKREWPYGKAQQATPVAADVVFV